MLKCMLVLFTVFEELWLRIEGFTLKFDLQMVAASAMSCP